MKLNPVRISEVGQPSAEGLVEPKLLDYGKASIKFRRQLTDVDKLLRDIWGPKIPQTEAGVRDVGPALDLRAVYLDGPTRIDKFLAGNTSFDESTRQRLKSAALAAAPLGWTPTDVGKFYRLAWVTRKRLDITNITAIDTPPAEVLKAQKLEYDADYKRRTRAEKKAEKRLLPKPPSAGERKAAELMNRRRAAIHAALPPTGLSIAKLCEILEKSRNGPFNMLGASLPRVVRRVIKADPSIRTEFRYWPGRRDLRPQLWLRRQSSVTETSTMIRSIDVNVGLPTNEDEYRAHVAARLAEFTPATAADDLPAWFNSPAEQALRAACGIVKRDELLIIANRVRNQLLAQREAKET